MRRHVTIRVNYRAVASHRLLVEALQTQLWSGQFDDADFAEAVRVACLARERAPFNLAGIDAERLLYQGALDLSARWMAVPFHGTLTLIF